MSQNNSVVKLKTVPTQVALEYAFAAYRINSGYIKENQDGTKSNRRIVDNSVKSWLNNASTEETLPYWVPNEFVVPQITDQDRDHVRNVDQHFKKYTFSILAGKLNDFENSIYTAVCGKEVSINKLGLIAYVPELINRDCSKLQFSKIVKTAYKNSSFQKIDTVQGVMTVLKVYNFEINYQEIVRSVTMGMNGNLYHFWDKKHKVDIGSEGKQYHVTGRVKSSAIDKDTGSEMTRLNYVKVRHVKTSRTQS